MELCQRSNEFKNYLHFEDIPTIVALSSGAGNANPPGTPEFTLSVSGIRASLLFLIFLMTIELFGFYTSGLIFRICKLSTKTELISHKTCIIIIICSY
jgi:hypothetical protein